MNRPRVIVHTVASIDGRVSLGPGRTGFDDVGDARWQAMWASDTALEDSVTDLVSFYGPQVLLEGSGSFVAEGEVLPQLLHLVAQSTPDDYLAFLRRREIPYLISGMEHVDLELTMEKMASLLGVTCVVCTAGSRLNGALLRANLIDEVSLVLLPALVGGSETPVLFRCPDLGPKDWPTRLVLLSIDSEPAGRVHLRYRIAVPREA